MSKVGQIERATQHRVVGLFRGPLKYDYLGNWKDRTDNSNIEEDLLRKYLKRQGYDETLISKALYDLDKAAGDQSKSLYDVNKTVYGLLRYGVKVKPEAGALTETVHLIDWSTPDNNDFAIAEEVTVLGEYSKRPDVVIYVNGIALGVLELKRSIVSIDEGIRQNLDNQKREFIQPFFATIQLVMAGNDTQGARYGTIETSAKYYLRWKEEFDDYLLEDTDYSLLDQHLQQLCSKERLLELLHDFIVFDAGTKKICRPNQYFGVKHAQPFVERGENGIIWHTQGSGKSLTMVWLTKWILENDHDARVLIVTDRIELDEQIEKVFMGVDEQIYRTESGPDLLDALNGTTQRLMCSLIHKFGRKQEGDVDRYIDELLQSLPSNFSAKGRIFVFVDECHRTQSGILHDAMLEILGDGATFIGFTGTPLLKADKKRSIEVFGQYIHTYRYNEAVKDGVVLDLRYEARDIDQFLDSPEQVEIVFDAKTRGLTDVARAQLKQKWGTMQKVLSSRSRLEMIVRDITFDMDTRDRLMNGQGNAILVAASIYEACKLYELFKQYDFDKCAIITSYKPSVSDIKGETTGEGETEAIEQYDIYMDMLGGRSVEDFEADVKRKFINEPGQMQLLIVVDKLLTGFDAPPATYLYINKSMRDHGLFQAICRVNRLDDESKEYGYIIDYKDLFMSLEQSIKDYTSGAFDGYDKEDVQELLTNRLDKGRERLEDALEAIRILVEPIGPAQTTQNYIHFFCGPDTSDADVLKDNERKRLTLYKLTGSLVRAYANLANEMVEAGYTGEQVEAIKEEVGHYEKVSLEVKMASGDYIDLKTYEPAMRQLIDRYVRAQSSKKISSFDDMTLIQLVVERGEDAIDDLPDGIKENDEAVAETIENNLRRVIIDENPVNPLYYDKMSKLLDDLIALRRQQAIDYADYLQQIIALSDQVLHPEHSRSYPSSLDNAAKRALYDNLGEDEARALAVDKAIWAVKKDGWRDNRFKEREVRNAIYDMLQDEALTNEIFQIVRNRPDY